MTSPTPAEIKEAIAVLKQARGTLYSLQAVDKLTPRSVKKELRSAIDDLDEVEKRLNP